MAASSKSSAVSRFPIPSSIQDLERAPYDLVPYPDDFNDDDEAARTESFAALVHTLEQGNRTLASSDVMLFQPDNDDLWMDEERIQALYTLVRYVENNPNSPLQRFDRNR
jgi:hypothetical protein